jgi:vacuolar-type H+-ATPase subunit F/Vma7
VSAVDTTDTPDAGYTVSAVNAPTTRSTTGTVVAIGERVRVEGFGLAGVLIQVAETADEIRSAWRALAADVALVLLTPSAATILETERATNWPMTAVMP